MSDLLGRSNLEIIFVGFAMARRIACREIGAVSLKQSFNLLGIKERWVFADISVKHGQDADAIRHSLERGLQRDEADPVHLHNFFKIVIEVDGSHFRRPEPVRDIIGGRLAACHRNCHRTGEYRPTPDRKRSLGRGPKTQHTLEKREQTGLGYRGEWGFQDRCLLRDRFSLYLSAQFDLIK